jgi:flagellar biogenesis protein FliO
MQVIPYAQPAQGPTRTREAHILMGCGVLLVFLGTITGLLCMLFAARAYGASSTAARYQFAAPVVVCLFASAATILTGIGSIRLRRWSRAVVVSVSGVLLVIGATTVVVVSLLHATAPPVFTTLHQAGGARLRGTRPLPPAIDDRATVFMSAALMLLVLAVLLVFFVVYRSPRIAGALHAFDTRRSWVDGRPIPVIALAVMLIGLAIAILLAMFSMPPIPIGFASADTAEARVILGGAMIVLAVFFAWSAWLVVRLHPLGPWLALLLIGLSAGVAIAAMTSGPLRQSFGRPGVAYGSYEISWYLQLASFRGLFAVAAYAIPAAMFVLYVRRILNDMDRATTPERLPL